eukprot:908138-Amphidinium_carterae.1
MWRHMSLCHEQAVTKSCPCALASCDPGKSEGKNAYIEGSLSACLSLPGSRCRSGHQLPPAT